MGVLRISHVSGSHLACPFYDSATPRATMAGGSVSIAHLSSSVRHRKRFIPSEDHLCLTLARSHRQQSAHTAAHSLDFAMQVMATVAIPVIEGVKFTTAASTLDPTKSVKVRYTCMSQCCVKRRITVLMIRMRASGI